MTNNPFPRTWSGEDTCQSIPERFEKTAALHGAKLAIRGTSWQPSFAELNGVADRNAAILLKRGRQERGRVALLMSHDAPLIAAALSVLKAGKTVVALNPTDPPARLEQIRLHVEPELVITDENHRNLALRAGFPRRDLLLFDRGTGGFPDGGSRGAIEPHEVAFLIYTSGSTGEPKGVMQTHRNILHNVLRYANGLGFRDTDRVILLASLSGGQGLSTTWTALLTGATLCPFATTEKGATGLSTWLTELGITVYISSPSLFRHFTKTLSPSDRFLNIRLVRLGSEQVMRSDFEAYRRHFSEESLLVNGFSSSEAGNITQYRFTESSRLPPEGIPVGKASEGIEILLLDESGNEVRPGEAGEIVVRSQFLSPGYWRNPALTSQRFSSDPQCEEMRMFHSGDLGRLLEDGSLTVTERKDFQVKVRGFRIEPGEIECVLREHPGVAMATVIVRQDNDGDKQLVAYLVTADPEEPPKPAEVREFLRQRLPDYMVPSAFVVLDKLPLTANGKIDRRTLPEPCLERQAEGYRAPRTPPEEILCGIYAELLGLERVGIDENFFSLGGHSLLAMQLVNRVRGTLGVELPVRVIFEAPSVAELMARLPRAGKAGPPLVRQERPERVPLSFAQQRLWFLDRLEGSSSHYTMREALCLRGELDVNALERAIQAVVERHESLRTRFVELEGEPCQVIEPLRIPLEVEDLSGLDESQLEEAIYLGREGAERFDLSRGPLLRVRLLKLGEGEHILFWTCHHIISDGWSVGVFHRDLRLAYEAFREGEENPLDPLQVQYADYAIWQRSWMEGKELERLLGYWQGQLAGAATLELPTDRFRPPRPSYSGGCYSFGLGAELSVRLAEFNRREKVTAFMSLLAAFEVLLYRYSGQADFMVGTPVANRGHVEVEGLIGFFVNSLVMRADLCGGPSFREVVSRVRRRALDAYQHQELPFEKLVEELNPEREMSRHPLFQVMFALQNASREALSLRGLEVSRRALSSSSTRFDLELHLWAQGEGWSGLLVYSRDLFEEATIEGMARHYVALLEGMLAEPERAVSEVPMMGEAERQRVVVEWNATGAEYPRERGIHEAFAEQARRRGQAIAADFGGRALSYGELDERSGQLAGYLRSLGIGPGERVAICVEPSPEMVIGLLGILKAGGAYVPIDPDYPEQRISWMLEDSGARVLLSRQGLGRKFSAVPVKQRVWLDGEWPASCEGGRPHCCAVGAEEVAYVMYTSGSTGKPKGVMVPHRAVNRLVVNSDYVELGAEDVVAQVANCCFDAATFEIWGALLNGSRLVGIEREEVLSAESFSQELSRHGVTTLFVTTALFNELVRERADIFRALRTVLFGGEECDGRAVRKVMESGGAPQRLVHVYGPTETTTFATWYEVRAGQQSWGGRIPIGRPIANTEVYIFDGHLNAVPVGVAGEICIGGEGVAKGYLNRPELSAERFIASPFARGQRLYRTGDRGRFLADGNIEFLGRLDDQVKIRGFRIELGEIEVAVGSHPAVRQAVVSAREGGRKEKHLVAYVVLAEGQKMAKISEELGAFLKRKLPDYMVPSAFVVLEKLPLTANGKIDRRALPAPERQAEGYRAARTPQEEILCGIYAELLSVERVGIDENFFSLGGHSLLAMQLVSRVRSTLGVELSVRTIFEAPTVGQLIGRLRGARKASAPPLVRQERPERLPLSFAQQRLWFLDRLEGSSSQYTMREAMSIEGELDIAALERAIEAVFERHEILRTSFVQHDGEPFSLTRSDMQTPFGVEDLSDIEKSHLEDAIDFSLRREAEEGFDLSRGPLLHIKLLRLGPRDHMLIWTCHHIISDGWSVNVFYRDLRVAYEAFCEGRKNPLGPLRVQYGDYALWQRSWLQGEALEGLLSYWRGELAGAGVLELAIDRARPPKPSYSGGRCSFELGAELSARLAEFNRREKVTAFMSLLAGFEVLLYRYSGQADFMVGTPVANRGHVEVEGLIGFFVNSLVMRADLSGEASFREVVSRVRRRALDGYQHQELPFEKLVEELNPEREMSRHPLFQVMFALQNAPREALSLRGLEVSRRALSSSSTRFDLELHLQAQGEGWSGLLLYSRDLFEEASIEGMARHYVGLLEGMLEEPERAVSLVPMMRECERERITVGWNATGVEYPGDRGIHQVFEEQVRRSPQAIAVVFGERELSYGELDDRSSKLAGYLSSLGVRPGERVAICMEPSVEMIVGLLGILKAGGAYVPIDPKYPLERISFMLADSGAGVLLTRQGLLSGFSGKAVKSVWLDGDWESREGLGGAGQPQQQTWAADGSEVAYVLYTSGSTGRPKGVCVPHRAVNRLVVNCDYVRLGPEEVVAQISNCCFDAATFEIWGALLNGSRLVGIELERVLSAEAFSGELARHGVTTLFVTTALFNELVRERADIFSKLRNVLFGGEEADPGVVRKVLESGPPQRLLHVYGPTETTTFATWYEVCSRQSWAGRLPIGRPIANTQVYILDGQLNAVPVGVAGEIWIGGEGVANGYLNRPELTEERFITSPFACGQRLYRTGDLGRFLADGNIEFLGRLDDQVKIRGFRIEFGEIEAVVGSHPAVRQAVVSAREGGRKEKHLVAYVVLAEGQKMAKISEELSAFLKRKLPDYMVPSAFVVLEKLPLTANGKIDRRALPAPLLDRQRASFVAPRTETEKTVAEAWSAVLNVQGIGVHDDFFQLGGHSLLATRVVSRLRSVSGIDIPLRMFFENATVAAIAEYIDGAQLTAIEPSEAPLLEREEIVI